MTLEIEMAQLKPATINALFSMTPISAGLSVPQWMYFINWLHGGIGQVPAHMLSSPVESALLEIIYYKQSVLAIC